MIVGLLSTGAPFNTCRGMSRSLHLGACSDVPIYTNANELPLMVSLAKPKPSERRVLVFYIFLES